jgi:hypothetical protein
MSDQLKSYLWRQIFSLKQQILNLQKSKESAKSQSLIDALIKVESGGNDWAVGDKHLADKAYGCLQIRKPCVDDVNRVYKTKYAAPGMLGNRKDSVDVFNRYMSIYATEKMIGRPVTDEDRARIWNGGPTGWKRNSTKEYWLKVKSKLTA